MQAAAVQDWSASETASHAWLLKLFPSLTDFAFLFPALILFGFSQGSGMLFSDGDTGWHIRTGEWILDHGAAPTFDLFSYTRPHQQWCAWEWGCDVIFALLHRASGLPGVAFFSVLLLCAISALLFRLIRRRCGNDLVALAFTGIAMLASSIHWLARPHLISWLFVLVFCHAVANAEEGNRRLLWWLPLLTIAWTNLHGAFLLGVVILLASALGEVMEAFAEPASWPVVYASAAPYVFCAAACVAASFINPYGWHLHAHVLSYLDDSKLLDHIAEFQSPNFHQPAFIFFEGMLLLGLASLAWCWQRRRYAAIVLIAAWAHLALVSARNIPFFVFFVAPWIAVMVCDLARRLHGVAGLGRAAIALRQISRELRPMERIERVYLASGVAVALMACGFLFHYPKFDARFSPDQFPVAAVPALQAAQPSHLFTTDQWGDYLIYRLYPSIRVFADGRSDFYGDALMTSYRHLVNARYDWQAQLRRFGVDAVLLRPDCPLATVLKQAPGWKVLFDNGSAVLFRLTEPPPEGAVFDHTTFTAERSLQTGRSTSTYITDKRRNI
jgi:hypothetical protein